MKKTLNIVFFLLLLLPLFLKAQTSNKVMNNLVINTLKEYQIPAISASLILPNGVFYGVKGTTKVGGNKKINLKSKFHLGSNTKAITAFIAMKMVENNQIKLATKFMDVFPELKHKIKKKYSNITLSDLLSHQANIQPYTSGLEYQKLPHFKGTISEKRYQFSSFVLNETPVKTGTYSNAGYTIASLMLEKKSKMSFEKLVKKYMFDLNLDYFIGFPNKETENNPAGHWQKKGKLVSHLPNHSYKLADYMLSAGDLSMNIIDYSKFIQLNLKGQEEDNVLTCENYKKLHFGFKGYSYGWTNSVVNKLKVSGHDGSAGTYYCHTVLIPSMKLAVVIMSNSAEKEHIKGIYQLRENILKNVKKITNEV